MGRLGVAAVVGAILLAAGCGGSKRAAPPPPPTTVATTTTAQASTVSVPRVVGARLAAATRQLSAAKLQSQPTLVAAKAATGVVVAQTPTAGSVVAAHSVVAIRVSRGVSNVPVPKVVGRPRALAAARLSGAGFVVAVSTVKSKKKPGTVLAEAPLGKHPAGTKIVLRVAATPLVSVPLVRRLPRAHAVAMLRRAGLRSRILLVHSPRRAGTVLVQKPKAGTRAAKGTRVTLKVSLATRRRSKPTTTAPATTQRTTTARTTTARTTTTRPAKTVPKTTTAATTPVPPVKRVKLAAALTPAIATTPRGTPAATGVFTGTLALSGTSGTLAWHIALRNLTGPPTSATIRVGAPPASGAVAIRLCAPCGATAAGTFHGPVSSQLANALATGGAAVVIATRSTAAGEAAGVVAEAPVTARQLVAPLTATQPVPKPNGAAAATGRFVGAIVNGTLSWHLTVKQVSGAVTAASIHVGAAGAVGPTILPLCGPCAVDARGTVTANAKLARALAARTAYVEVDTQRNPHGEVRGKVAVR